MNVITIEFDQGTAAWKDMQEVVKLLNDKGYSTQPYGDIGTVKLTKEIEEEMNVSNEEKMNEPDHAAMNKTKEGTFKRILVEANYPWELIKDWTEDECKAERGAIERANKTISRSLLF
ncbi:hypothetical protein IK3_05664 [Bacillus toyonensis]|uniref:hypothetical protein n=1 Tax=Bacillus toyonensis TaxID=155322 RepID=UPI000279DCE2|nr:hypothetical protein [Bacillus toyonensis]EJR55459.1 hypothetical protein IK3_05664 [Bacillus toyonensis]